MCLPTQVRGKGACLDVWRGFFAAFSNYRNDAAEWRTNGVEVAMAGSSSCSDKRLDGPALWLAVTNGTMVAEWQVLDDDKTGRKKIGLAG